MDAEFKIAFPKVLNVNDNQFFVVGGSLELDFQKEIEFENVESQIYLVDVIHSKIMYTERPFDFPIRMHAACGLLSELGIYILGGRYQEWTDKAYFYDIKIAGTEANISINPLKEIKTMPNALFGPAMTKPTQN